MSQHSPAQPGDQVAALRAAIRFHRDMDRGAIAHLKATGELTSDMEAGHAAALRLCKALEIALEGGADPVLLCRQTFRAGSVLLGFLAGACGLDAGHAWNLMMIEARKGFEHAGEAGRGEARQGNIPEHEGRLN